MSDPKWRGPAWTTPREPKGRGATWADERRRSDEGPPPQAARQARGRREGGPEARGKVERRDELAAFLRSRRERITPEDVGLPGGHRRRTAGLRREVVAQLAGV